MKKLNLLKLNNEELSGIKGGEPQSCGCTCSCSGCDCSCDEIGMFGLSSGAAAGSWAARNQYATGTSRVGMGGGGTSIPTAGSSN